MGELRALSKFKMAGKLHYWRGTIEISEHETRGYRAFDRFSYGENF